MDNKLNDLRKKLAILLEAEKQAKGLGVVNNNIKDKNSHQAIKNDKKVKNTAKSANDASYKATAKAMKDYEKASTTDIDGNFVPPKNNVNSNDDNGGMEDLVYDATNDEFKERQKKAIEGDSTMGNEDTDATEMTDDLKDPKLGKNIIKKAKDKHKRNLGKRASVQFGDVNIPTPEYDGKRIGDNKKIATENKKQIKRLTFKTPFNGVETAVKVIPESFKTDKNVFEVSDKNETYRIRWEGTLTEGKAIILKSKVNKLVSEDIDKMKHLMGFKSEDTLGTPDAKDRITENQIMKALLNNKKK